MNIIQRSIRLSQAIVPFGVGAIYDIMGESLVACDISYWRGKGKRLDAPRLAEYLNKEGFREPPSNVSSFSSQGGGKLPYFRFPSWLFCSRCRKMYFWRPEDEIEGTPPTCNQAACSNRQLVPMRFVMVCRHGHMSDVPWHFWVHVGASHPRQKQCRSKDLSFHTLSKKGGGLKSLEVRCDTCRASRSMQGITSEGHVKGMLNCSGKQPWQRLNRAEECEVTPLIVQRGASNVHYPEIVTSIDIPPFSRVDYFGDISLKVTNHNNFPALISTDAERVVSHLAKVIAESVGCSRETVRRIAEDEKRRVLGKKSTFLSEDESLEAGEWRAFITEDPKQTPRDRFITDHVDLLPTVDQPEAFDALNELIEQVVVVRKLREVRTLTGFYRVHPGGEEDSERCPEKIYPDCGHGLDWLPATEVFGEGIFLSLREKPLQTWEENEHVLARVSPLRRRLDGSIYNGFLPEVTPRFILLHTLSHLLIRQLAFACGYASSSLRERIYCKTAGGGDPMAGLLVYTAAGDVEGTLGGLARQGEPPRLARTLLSALQRGSWCSTDPICAESTGQGTDALNLGACHACSLLSETSCVHVNLLLDRVTVVGGADNVPGFFDKPVEHAFKSGIADPVIK